MTKYRGFNDDWEYLRYAIKVYSIHKLEKEYPSSYGSIDIQIFFIRRSLNQ